MRDRGFFVLVAAAAVMVALAAIVALGGDRMASPGSPGQRALPGLADKLDGLGFLRLTRGAMTINFRNAGQLWTVVEKGNYPADQDRLRKLLLQLAELELIEPKTARSELLPRLDLDDPANGKSTEVTVQDRSGALVAQLVIGRRRPNDIDPGDAAVYVRRPGSFQAWLARGSFELGGDTLTWLDRRIIDLVPARIASVVLTAADGAVLALSRAAPGQPFAIDGLPGNAQPKPDAALAAPAAALEALDLADVRPAAEQPIAEEGVASAAFTTFDGLVVGLRLSPPEAGDWLAIDATGSGAGTAGATPLSARLSHWRFAIPPERAKLLRTTLPDLLQPHGS